MIQIICDRCKKIVRGGYIKAYFYTRSDRADNLLKTDWQETKHFCLGCMPSCVGEDAQEAGEIVSAAQTEPSGQAELEKKPRRKIDYGKIMALKKAGWDLQKIAEEMCMTKQSVSMAIYTYKKRREGEPPTDPAER